VDGFDALWRELDGGEQSYVRRAARRGLAAEARLAPAVAGYAGRRLRRWWLDLAEIAPATVLLLLLPLFARRDLGPLTADDAWPERILALAAVVAGFAGWRRTRYARAVRVNGGDPGGPAGSR
jgi:hypothetical protein